MVLHPQIESLLRSIGALVDDPGDGPAEFRSRYVRWSSDLLGELGSADAQAVRCGDFKITTRSGTVMPARLYLPRGVERPRPMVYFHGGHGFAGDIHTHHHLCVQLSALLQVGLICPSLPSLADVSWSHWLGAAQDVLLIADRKRQDMQLGDQGLWVAGDGTGALLAWQAARACAMSTDSEFALATRAALLFYPYAKPDLSSPSHLRHTHALALNRTTIGRAWSAILGPQWHLWRPDIIPFHAPADTLALLPTMVVAAECDALHDDGMHMHDFIAGNNGIALFRGAPQMPHDFARMACFSAQARSFLQQICADFVSFALEREGQPATQAPAQTATAADGV